MLATEGRAAVTTRGVSAGSGVQPPTIYRLFGDMDSLLQAVAADGFARYLGGKTARLRAEDPVDDLRGGWDLHVQFGLENRGHYLLMFGEPRPGAPSAAVVTALDLLHGLIRRVAEAGRLAVDIDFAAEMVHAAAVGTTLALLAMEPGARESALSIRLREAVIAAVTSEAAPTPPNRRYGRRRLRPSSIRPHLSTLRASG